MSRLPLLPVRPGLLGSLLLFGILGSAAGQSPGRRGEARSADTLHLARVLALQPMEDSTDARFVREPRYRGAFSLRCDPAPQSPDCVVRLDSTACRPGDYLRVRVMAFFHAADLTADRGRMARLVIDVPCSDRELVQSARITPLLGNRYGQLSYPGTPDRWGEAAFFVQLPPGVLLDAETRIYITNPYGQKLYVDDLALELWRYER